MFLTLHPSEIDLVMNKWVNRLFVKGGFIIIFLLFFTCSKEVEPKADLIIKNGKIITVDSSFSIATALAIREGKFIGVGSDDEMKKYAGAQTKQIDVQGKTVIPGLIDGHTHPESASISELVDEIPDLHSIRELMDWIKLETTQKEEGEWIIHPKMFHTRLKELRLPSLEELDLIAPNHPVFLNGAYGGLINSAAMKASGITNNTVHEGLIRNNKNGKFEGVIRRSAFDLLKIPSNDFNEREKDEALVALLHRYNQYGITGIISGSGDLSYYQRYRRLSRKNELTVRVSQNMMLPFDMGDSPDRLIDSLKRMREITGPGDEWVRPGSIKIVLDGGILTGTAYLRAPWGKDAFEVYNIKDPEYRGVLRYSADELFNIVSAVDKSGWAFTAHCTGGGGVDMLLDAFEQLNLKTSVEEKRFSIIHGNFFTREAISRMQQLGILANIQPAWFYKDAKAMKYVLGDERIKTFNPYRSMVEGEVILCGGSDHMVKVDANTSINPYNPFLSMWSMITRKTEGGTIITANEQISREQALRTYTINNAYASFDESSRGSIEVGKWADLAVLSDDLLTCPVDQIKEIRSELTLLGGEVVFD